MKMWLFVLIVALVASTGCGGADRPGPVQPGPDVATSAPYRLLAYVSGASVDGLPVAQDLDTADPLRAELEPILRRPYLRWILALGAEARKIARRRCTGPTAECDARHSHPALFVVMKGGNRPKHGLAIRSGSKTTRLPDAWYVEIDPQSADLLIPHEYGHTMMFGLLPGDVPGHPGTLPHTTSAITNDVTAFSEAWGIHFETLAADRRETEGVYGQRRRDSFPVAPDASDSDSLLPAKDLLSYAQSYRRYTCIKENCFAFLPRVAERFRTGATPTGEDLVARWTDATHDPALLRSLPQMVASEGVIAALFYRLATAPEPTGPTGAPGDPRLPDVARYRAFFEAFATLSEQRLTADPAILVFLTSLLDAAPVRQRRRMARIILEVLHFTPVWDDAQDFYRRLHELGHVMDVDGFRRLLDDRRPAMQAAVSQLVQEPARLLARPVRELWVKNETLTLSIPIFGMEDRPLVFDVNTAPVEFLMSIPGIGLDEARALVRERDRRGGFRDMDELMSVAGPGAAADALKAMRHSYVTDSEKR